MLDYCYPKSLFHTDEVAGTASNSINGAASRINFIT